MTPPNQTHENPFALDGAESETPSREVNIQPEIQDIITRFQNSGDFTLQGYADTLERISLNITSENQEEVALIIGRLKDETNEQKLLEYIIELQGVTIRYETDAEEVTSSTAESLDSTPPGASISTPGGSNPESGMLDTLVVASIDPMGYLFGPESLRRIHSIDIGGEVGSPESFRSRMNALKNIIQTTPEFQILSDSEKINIINWIEKLTQDTIQTQETSLENIDTLFDGLANQIESQADDGNIEITQGDLLLEFPSKEEAYAFIEMLKIEADNELETAWVNLFEEIGDGLLYTLDTGWEILTTPYSAFANIGVWGATRDTGSDILDYGIAGVLLLVSSAMTFNYTETLFRRILLDTLGKLGIEHPAGNIALPLLRERVRDANNAPVKDANGRYQYRPIQLVIPDFNTSPDFYTNGQNVDLRNEYLQRIQAIRLLEAHLRGLTGRERDVFEGELQKVKTYLNVNTQTFWLKAWSLDKDHGILMRSFNALRGPFGWNLRNVATRHFNLDESRKEEFMDGLRYVFDGTINIEVKDGRLVVTGDTGESQNIKNAKNYILGQSSLSTEEKNRRIHHIDELLEELRDNPAGVDYIKHQLLNIAREGYLSQDEVLAEIAKKLQERHPSLKVKPKNLTWAQWFDKLLLKPKEFWGNIAPASFTARDSMLFKFQEIVRSGGWEGNSEHLDEVFQRVESGNLEIAQLLRSRPLGTLGDFARGFVNRYGISTPQITELIRHGEEYTDDEMKAMLDAGKTIGDTRDKIKKIIEGGFEFDGQRRNPLNAVRNYIDFFVNDTEEKRLKPALEAYLKDITEGKIFYSELEFFRELKRVMEGYIPSYKLLDALEKLTTADNITSAQKANIGLFITQAEQGKLNFKQSDITALKAGTLIFDPAGPYITGDFTDLEKRNFINGIKDFEGLSNYNFRDKIGIPTSEAFNLTRFENALISKYRVELDQLRILGEINGTTNNIEAELKKFAGALEHNYTFGQADIILTRIFAGETFESIDLEAIIHDTTINHTKSFDIKSQLLTQLVRDFTALTGDPTRGADVEKILNYIINHNISQDTLPEEIKNALAGYSNRGTEQLQIERNRAALQSYIDEISQKNTIEDLRTLETRFNQYIDNTGNNINRASPDYINLLETFRTSIDTKKVEVEISGNRTQLERFFQEMGGARTLQRLNGIQERFETFIAGIDSTNSNYIDIIQDINDTYDTKFTTLGGTAVPPTVAPVSPTGPTSPEAERAPEVRESREVPYNELKNFLDSIYPSILMLDDPEAITKINQEYTLINDSAEYRIELGAKGDLLDHYKNMFNGRDIFRLNDLNVNLEGMRRVLSQIDSKFAVPRTYSQMGDIIRGTFNPSNSEAILRALREFRLVR